MKKSIVSILLITLLLSFSYGALSADDVAKEAPALAELVAQGKLPPLEERIPEVPLVVVPLESIGTYGGVWHNMIIGGDTTHLERYQDYEQLVRWTPDWSGYIPNVAERFEISEDSTEFTFYLRKGMKWSDGTPFTSLDFDYQYNYFLLNKELTNVFPITYKDAKLALQYTEYDVAKANEYLDKVLPNKGPDGMRLLPSGEKLIIRADIDMARDAYIDASELLTQYWAAVGVELKVDVVSRDLWEERTRNGDGTFDMTIHRFGGGAGTLIYTDPRYYFPFDNNSMYAMAWRNYYVDPTGFGAKIPPEEPPADVLRQMELYNQIKVTGDAEEQREYMKEILEIAVDRFYTIGVCTEGDSYAICNNDLVNVPDEMPWNWVYPHPMPTNPFTWYYRTGK